MRKGCCAQIVVLCGLFLGSISGFATTDLVTPRTITFSSLLNFYGQPVGEAVVKVTPEKKLFVQYDTIANFLSQKLTPEKLSEIQPLVKDGFINSDDLAAHQIDLDLSATTLETSISIPKSMLTDSGLYLFQGDETLVNARPIDDFSGYANYYLSASYLNDDQSALDWFSSNVIETGLRYQKINLFNDFAFDIDDEDSNVYRLLSQITYDFPDEGTRMTYGDLFFGTYGFQSGESIFGLNISRDFGIIPTKNVRPIANQQFVIERPSSVDVYIDSILMRSIRLSPGAYDIRDLPLTTGVNNIQLVITDPSGRQEVIQFNIATGINLLAAGEYEYSVSLGIDSELVDDQLEYDKEDYVFSAGFDYGITESVTAGLNMQARKHVTQAGVTSGFANALGLFGAEAAYSQHKVLDDGYALRLKYDAFSPSEVFTFNAQYEYYSPKFSSISDSEIDSFVENPDGVEHRVDLFYNYFLTDRLSAGIATNARYLYSHDLAYAVTPTLAGSWFGTAASWNIRATYENDEDPDTDEWQFFLATSIPIDALLNTNHQMSASYDSVDSRSQVRYSYNENIGSVGGVGVFALVENNDDENFSGSVSANYTGNRYIMTFDHDSLVDVDGNYSNLNRVGIQGATAFSGSDFAIGRPVNDAFAIISVHDSLSESPVMINPEVDGTFAVQSDFLGPMLYPDIVSYRPQRIDYDVEDLPIGYDLGEGGFAINPQHGSSYRLTIGSDANMTALGYLFDVSSKPIPLTEGRAVHQGDPDFAPVDFFTNSKGRFAITGLKPGAYRVSVFSQQPFTFNLSIPESAGNIIRLGEIRAGQ
ncbi:fimbria/pilus outer membrane usher protein [Photobacterium sp. 1_MG-2023]|uniref:fimbria/pilus outer membrane usher protein n=1 Tax=Photobacterium sp. 1_MG-2023 TaxID=3062646 RepID=UPI0026E2A2FE|nr:fimbria/pilus outer membrane usher protein [Photobacterium sp. 1_MG-2023]MDO6708550.1 fimbria/pilus outer membrane usher protein [Photobacterium sp. 1_MG-2023]